ncbi:hypothetical protein V6N13_051332 [Hibiscus sabdariffa]
METLQFTEAESGSVVMESPGDEGESSLWLVGSVVTNKIVKGDSVCSIFRSVWKSKHVSEILELRPNFFLIKPVGVESKDMILKRRPWVVHDDLFSIELYNPTWWAVDFKFNNMVIWVRVYQLPLRALNGAMGLQLGGCIAPTAEVPISCVGTGTAPTDATYMEPAGDTTGPDPVAPPMDGSTQHVSSASVERTAAPAPTDPASSVTAAVATACDDHEQVLNAEPPVPKHADTGNVIEVCQTAGTLQKVEGSCSVAGTVASDSEGRAVVCHDVEVSELAGSKHAVELQQSEGGMDMGPVLPLVISAAIGVTPARAKRSLQGKYEVCTPFQPKRTRLQLSDSDGKNTGMSSLNSTTEVAEAERRNSSRRRISELHSFIDSCMLGPLRASDRAAFLVAKKEHKALLDKEESYWEQRSCVRWLTQGDRNTAYFHARASDRRKKNKIRGLYDDDTECWTDKHAEVAGVVTRYFSTLFSSSQPLPHPSLLSNILPCIDSDINSSLMRPFSNDDILAAFQDIDPHKAPGIDGLPGSFYRQHWDILGQDCFSTYSYPMGRSRLRPSSGPVFSSGVWSPPPSGTVAISVDGAFAPDHDGSAFQLRGLHTAESAEACAFKEGVRMAIENDWTQVVFEGDSATVVSKLDQNELDRSHTSAHLWSTISKLVDHPGFSFSFLRRAFNRAAHGLAQWAGVVICGPLPPPPWGAGLAPWGPRLAPWHKRISPTGSKWRAVGKFPINRTGGGYGSRTISNSPGMVGRRARNLLGGAANDSITKFPISGKVPLEWLMHRSASPSPSHAQSVGGVRDPYSANHSLHASCIELSSRTPLQCPPLLAVKPKVCDRDPVLRT